MATKTPPAVVMPNGANGENRMAQLLAKIVMGAVHANAVKPICTPSILSMGKC